MCFGWPAGYKSRIFPITQAKVNILKFCQYPSLFKTERMQENVLIGLSWLSTHIKLYKVLMKLFFFFFLIIFCPTQNSRPWTSQGQRWFSISCDRSAPEYVESEYRYFHCLSWPWLRLIMQDLLHPNKP